MVSMKAVYHLYYYSWLLVSALFSEQVNLRSKVLLLLSPTKQEGDSKSEIGNLIDQKRNKSPEKEMLYDND